MKSHREKGAAIEKAAVDRIITDYLTKIYGFALSKTGDSRPADELASDIIYEVYISLLKANEIYNVNSYIWRISSYHLGTRIAQNIAYAAYDEPKTEAEIAEELGVSPLYLDEFIQHLANFAFLTRLPDGKLRTDVIIHRPTKESTEATHAVRVRTAERIADTYLETMVANLDAYMDENRDALYIPDGDRNLWRWTAFMDAWYNMDYTPDVDVHAAVGAFRYKRPDGGNFTAYAILEDSFEVDFDESRYWCCGQMNRWSDLYGGLHSIQFRTNYDSRTGGWADNQGADYVSLYECYTGNLPETKANAEKYRRLFERGLVVWHDGKISVNIPVALKDAPEIQLFAGVNMDELCAMLRECGQAMADIDAPLYPAHVQDYIRASYLAYPQGMLFMYLYEQMLNRGYLTVPEDDRRGGLMTLMKATSLPTV